MRIERLTHDPDGAPLDAEPLFYRAGAFEYRASVERNRRG